MVDIRRIIITRHDEERKSADERSCRQLPHSRCNSDDVPDGVIWR